VIAQELSASLSPTGKQYSYQTTSDLGTFTPNNTFTSQYIGLSATGYYFDEVANAVSGGTITLNGYSDLSAASVLNVNLLTTLAFQRIQNLMTKSGTTFVAAQTQAESEVLAALAIHNAALYGHFSTLDISKGTDGDKMLAALSSLFVYGNTSGNLAALIASVQSDIGANGTITSAATKATLLASAQALSPATVATNLSQKYASVGVSFTSTDISNWIDQDGDGLVGKFKFVVPDAAPSSTFAFPSFVTDPYAGTSVSVSVGQLSVNGTLVSGSVQIKTGDAVAVSPPAGAFPNGLLTAYLMSGATKIGRVSFVKGLSSIAVTPTDPTIPVGLSQQLTATATFTDSSTANVTSSANWASSTTSIAAVDAASGLATAMTPGSTTVSAAVGSVVGSAIVTVVPAALQSIALTPNPLATGIGIARRLTATGTYSDASTRDLTSIVTWDTLSQSIATVTGGLVTGVSLGSTSITATSGGVSASVPVNVTTNTWTAAATNIALFALRGHTATLLNDGRVLVAGGVSGSAMIYDPNADTWKLVPNMAGAREYGHTATLLGNGKVLVAGGGVDDLKTGGFYSTASAEVYDPATDTWTSAGNMSTSRAFHTATLLGSGKVLVVAGEHDNGGDPGGGVNLSAEIYDPATNTWTPAAALTTARTRHTATLLNNGKVLVAGGLNYSSPALASVEIYDPTSNVWTIGPSMASARYSHTATLLNDGHVLVAGGVNNSGSALSSVEIYDPVSNTWTAAASLSTARLLHTATLLGSGRVLVAGGEISTTDPPLASAEVFDPTSNAWSSASSMTNPRQGHTATLLNGGAVFVTGGDNRAMGVGSSSELYW
jgi:N-acetylneuraminic acid mutarotase